MPTISRREFEQLCDEVATRLPPLLAGVTDQSERTERALEELFVRVCVHLRLDPNKQRKALPDSGGFRLMQTVEEHMDGEFPQSTILDERLLMRISSTERT
jgi:hypothetical protein